MHSHRQQLERVAPQRWQASLPMYDFDALRAATDSWWRAIAQRIGGRLGALPAALTRGPAAPQLWRDDNLLLSQSCGYPLTHEFSARLQVVATPSYTAPGCNGAHYASAIVVGAHSDLDSIAQLGGTRLAYNMTDSMSGYRAWQLVPDVCLQRSFSARIETGSHRDSLLAVGAAVADVAAVDAVSLALLTDTEPALVEPLRVLDFTPAVPGLPYVTRADAEPDTVEILRCALAEAAACAQLAGVRQRLRIGGIEVLPTDAYAVIAALI